MTTPEHKLTTSHQLVDQSIYASPETPTHTASTLHRPSDGKETTDSDTPQEQIDKGRSIRGFRWIIICFSIYVTCGLYGLDTTIAADVQGPVISDLGHVEQLAWGKLHPIPIKYPNIDFNVS